MHERLCGVDIERLPYAGLIDRYDTPETLFYLDPPYHGSENHYGPGMFSEADFDALRAILGGIEGRFVMSINDVPAMRRIFSGFDIEPVGLNYRVSGRATPAGELIVTGGRP